MVPEYAFLEPRGMGIFDGKDVASVLPVVRKKAFSLFVRSSYSLDTLSAKRLARFLFRMPSGWVRV